MTAWTPPGPALLFVPADRPDRFAKAAARADGVILDLEDGCRQENLDAARTAVRDCGLDPSRTIVRVHPPGTADLDADLAAVVAGGFRTVMVPKTEGAADLDRVVGAYRAAAGGTATDAPALVPLVETPAGAVNLREIAGHGAVVALFWGAEDLTAALGGTSSRYAADEVPTPGGGPSGHPGGYREVPRAVRASVLLHAAAAGVWALDSIHADTADTAGAAAEARDAAASGFAATVLIHPGLAPAVRDAYTPSPEQVALARRVTEAARGDTGAFAVDGRMVDAPLLRQAAVVLSRIRDGDTPAGTGDTGCT